MANPLRGAAAITGLGMTPMGRIFFTLGVDAGWWTWSADDPVLAERWLGRAQLRFEKLGDPEAIADLNQFSPCYDNRAVRTEGARGQRERCGSVVHDMNGLGHRHSRTQRRHC